VSLTETELSMERVTVGLPDAITDIPERLLVALEARIIKRTDLAPNIAAIVASDHPAQIEPPLNINEQVARTQHINKLAANCVQQFMNS
jgi:hypothetical protein